MKDNTLLLILCIILIVIVLYYIFNSCKNNEVYSNKLNTNNKNNIIKLNKKNELMTRDLFQDTSTVLNINDFFINNNIILMLSNNSGSVNKYIKSNFGNNINISDNILFTQNKYYFIFKMTTLDAVKADFKLYNHVSAVTEPIFYKFYKNRNNCGLQFIDFGVNTRNLIKNNKNDYIKFFKIENTEHKYYKLNTLLTKYNEIYEIDSDIIPDNTLQIINENSDYKMIISSYTKKQFYYNNTEKNIDKIYELVSEKYPPGICADFNSNGNKLPEAFKILMGVDGQDNISNDIIPYKFIDFTIKMNEILKMFYLEKNNVKLIYDKEFKIELKEEVEDNENNNIVSNTIQILCYNEEDETHFQNLNDDFDYDNNIVIGVIIPLGKQALIEYKSIAREEIENEPITFNNVEPNTIVLKESTLYIDRHIEGDYNDSIDYVIYSGDYVIKDIGQRKTKRANIIAQLSNNTKNITKNLFMKSHYRYVDKGHAKKNHIKITKITEQENDTKIFMNFNNDTLSTSSNPTNFNVNIKCYNPNKPLNKIFICIENTETNYFSKLLVKQGNISVEYEKEDKTNKKRIYNNFNIQVTPIRINDNSNSEVKYYKLENNIREDIRLYIIPTEINNDEKFFILVYFNKLIQFLKLTEDNEIILTKNYDDSNKEKYKFYLKNYEEEENFQNTINEKFENDSKIMDKYKEKPIVIDVDASRGINTELRTSLYKYQSGIYTSNSYLLLSENSTIKTNNNDFILFDKDKLNSYTYDNKFEDNKLYGEYKDNNLKTIRYEDDTETDVIKKNVDIIYKIHKDNKFSDINGLSYGSFLILKNKNGNILHCIYDVNSKVDNNNPYKFEWSNEKDSIKFYSIYKNNVLQESYSPYFTIDSITGATGITKKRFVFAISNYRVSLNNDTENSNKILMGFNGYDENNPNKYYNNFDYYEIKNVFNTPMRFKSSPDIQIDINKIDMTFQNNNMEDKVNQYIFEYNIQIRSDPKYNNIINYKENYTFDYEEDIRNSNLKIFNINNITLNSDHPIIKYMVDYTTKMENLVGCLNNQEYSTEFYKKLIGTNVYNPDTDNKCENTNEGSLNINIKKLIDIKKEREVITKNLISNIKTYKNQAINTIKQTIIPKQKELYEIIYEIYNKETEIEEMNYKIQNKIQFSFNISKNIKYLEYLREEKEKAHENIKELENKIKFEKRNNYKNLLKVNEYILKINKNINSINSYLERNKNVKEYFFNNGNNNVNLVELNNMFNEYNIKVENNFENILKLSKIIKHKVKTKDKLNNEIMLNDKVNNYYSILNGVYKNKQLSNNDYIFSDEFSKLSNENYMKILGNLILELDKKKMDLDNKLKFVKEKHLTTKRKLEKNNFKEVNYKVNNSQITTLEMDLMIIYNKINDLKQNISNDYLLKKAKNKLIEIKNLNIKIKDEGVNKFNVLEPFVSSNNNSELNKRFNTIQSHNDGYLSVLPNNYSNEYKININGKCLSSYSSNDYDLQNCENKEAQFFEPRLINSKIMSEVINKDKVNSNNVKYPYYQMVSSLSRDCLTKEGENISILPCTSNNKNQRWDLIENEVKCLDN